MKWTSKNKNPPTTHNSVYLFLQNLNKVSERSICVGFVLSRHKDHVLQHLHLKGVARLELLHESLGGGESVVVRRRVFIRHATKDRGSVEARRIVVETGGWT